MAIAEQVQKGRFVVLGFNAEDCKLSFTLAGEMLWLGKVEHRGVDSLKVHYYQQQCRQPGAYYPAHLFFKMLIGPALQSLNYYSWQDPD